ncbi:MAG: sigma-70 family RNA polymerase sigma factor [Myxococcales bacterium]|nr:MAG: sigma-70 family RNA polymerase sigma factor [Myxococcales bacterium]
MEPLSAALEQQVLLSAAISGDGIAFRKLVSPHLEMLHRLAARACSDPELAKDAVQESLVLAYMRLSSVKEQGSVRAFLAGITVKRSKTLLRSEKRRAKRQAEYGDRRRYTQPDEMLGAKEMAARVREILASMPSKRSQVAMLRLDAKLSYAEIAEALKISERSARVLLHLAL